MMGYGRWIGHFIKWMLLVAALLVIFGYITMRLWNGLMPDIFGLPLITFGQALGLLILAKILFKGFGWKGGYGKCGCYGGGHGGHGWKGGYWRKRWDEKIASMTPEEREKLR